MDDLNLGSEGILVPMDSVVTEFVVVNDNRAGALY